MPYSKLLSSPSLKRGSKREGKGEPIKTPLIIHLPRVYSLIDVYKLDFIEKLGEAVRNLYSDVLVVTTTDQAPGDYLDYGGRFTGLADLALDDPDVADYHPPPLLRVASYSSTEVDCFSESTVIRAVGRNPRKEAICIVPSENRSQRNLFSTHKKLEESCEQGNVRLLQRAIRQICPELRNLPIAQPLADWGFLDTPTKDKLVKHQLCGEQVIDLVSSLKKDSTEQDVKEAVIRLGRREKAIDDWCDNIEGGGTSKRSALPLNARNVIKKVEQNYRYEWERRFLSLLINPDDVEEGWSKIALEPEVKEAIVQLIQQPALTGLREYGILERGRIRGALLYGPPGTGKTHLARVLARESKAIMICVSAADLTIKWVGDTEKAIRGLFNLARMLSPCTIFIDEADALFRLRKDSDHSWERSQMNQLLYEMDGLKKSKTPPFVILATNYPSQLDHAVLRRVPSRIHIGLPSSDARQKIFEICLEGEKLHTDVNAKKLADMARGYSGSDIETVCVQAALICDTVVGDGDTRRLLKHSHFEKAFKRSASTVSQVGLAEIEAFAKSFDPMALDHMERQQDVSHFYV